MEELTLIGILGLGITFLATSIFSRKTTSFFIVIISIFSLHLLLPMQIPLEPGVTIHAGDIFFTPLAVATVIRLLSMRRISGLRLLWLLTSLYLFIAFAHGALNYGLLSAAASYRSSLYLSVGVLYFSTFEYSDDTAYRDLKWISIAGTVLTLCAFVLWLFPQLRPDSPYGAALHLYERNRVLPAQAALFLGLAGLASLPAWLETNGNILYRGLGLLSLATAISLFHRTVWIALAAAMLPLAVLSGRKATRALLLLQMLVVALLVLWLFLGGLDMDVFSTSIDSAIHEITEEQNSTLEWRIEGWRILVDNAIADGPMTILLGAGFGIGFERTIANEYVTVSPHNYYIELFLTSGLLGCGLYILAGLAALLRAVKLFQQERHPIPLTLAGIIVCVLVYGGAYTPQFDAALLLGLAMSLPLSARPSSARR